MDYALNISGEWTMLGVPSLFDLAGCLCKTARRAGGSAASGGGDAVQACHPNSRRGGFTLLGHTEGDNGAVIKSRQLCRGSVTSPRTSKGVLS